MIKATFNIINQKYGVSTPYATFLGALGDLPNVTKTSKGLPPLYATFNITNRDLNSLCESLGVNYWDTVKSVAELCIASNDLETSKYKEVVSKIEGIPIYIKTKPSIDQTLVNYRFPNSKIQEIEGEERFKTFGEWKSSVFQDAGEGYVWGSVLHNNGTLNTQHLLEFMLWAENNPELEITFLTLDDIHEINNIDNEQF